MRNTLKLQKKNYYVSVKMRYKNSGFRVDGNSKTKMRERTLMQKLYIYL